MITEKLGRGKNLDSDRVNGVQFPMIYVTSEITPRFTHYARVWGSVGIFYPLLLLAPYPRGPFSV
jgi:hypothetical protein